MPEPRTIGDVVAGCFAKFEAEFERPPTPYERRLMETAILRHYGVPEHQIDPEMRRH